MGKDVIAFGDLVADIILPIPELPLIPGRHQIAQGFFIEPGGAGNFLIMSARLGLSAAAIDWIGGDLYGRQVREILASEGVDISGVKVLDGGQTTLVLVLVDEPGEHVFLGVLGNVGLGEIGRPYQQDILEARAFYTNGHAFLLARAHDLVLDAIKMAKSHGVPVFFDPGPQIPNIEPDLVRSAVAHTDVLLLTLEEAILLADKRQPAELARALLSEGPDLVVIKMGPEGCFIANQESSLKFDAFPVEVRDPCGAGDAFDAACVYGFLSELPIDQIAILANAVGAATVTKLGTGRRLPGKEEILSLLKRHSLHIPL